MDRDLSALFFSYEMYLCGTFLGIIFCIRNYNIHKNKKTIKQLQSRQLGDFLEMPIGIASYQIKEIIDNTIAEFEKNKLKNFYE